MSVEQLGLLAGLVLSLAFSYIPKLKDWYEGLGPEVKRLVMAALLLVVSAAVYAGSCWNLGLPWAVACDQSGLLGLAVTFVAALVANQATYLISPKTSSG